MSLDNKQMTGVTVDDQGSGINHWLRLPDEMSLYILRQLPRKSLMTVSLVNWKLRDLSLSLCTELSLDYEQIKRNEESCKEFIQRCKKLTCLEITNKTNTLAWLNFMTVAIGAKETLKSLDVHSNIRIRMPAAMEVLGCLKNLTSLTLTISLVAKAGAKMLEELANLEKLEVLNLVISGNHDNLPVLNLKSVFKKLKKLKKVDIALDYVYEVVGECFVVDLATNNPDLTELYLMNYPSLTDETLELLANSCLGLEEFSSWCVTLCQINRALTDSGIERMVSLAKNLRKLCLDRGPQMTRC